MNNTPTILVFAGSTRQGSFTKQLAQIAARTVDLHGGKASFIDLADYEAPLYHQDNEANGGLPDAVTRFRALLHSHDGMMVATPEYNGFVPPLLVNMFSWVSRPYQNAAANALFHGMPVGLMAASPGGLGGVRVIPRLRDYMAELGAVAVPGFVTLSHAATAFDKTGSLQSETAQSGLDALARRLISACQTI
ncbi:NADPH-dependent FMN reductase [Candidatus Puniceispirillum sp.]|uniref:NADPH-dependent FMN reductase n=1 Tax=Candidatus Puniceispirillum sp. TaxID=2026719 RepID=UPI003F69D87D